MEKSYFIEANNGIPFGTKFSNPVTALKALSDDFVAYGDMVKLAQREGFTFYACYEWEGETKGKRVWCLVLE